MKQAILDGYICASIDTKSTSNGKEVVTFSINSPSRIKNGEKWENKAEFFDCKLWLRPNDFRQDFIKEGERVFLVCEPRQERWESDGVKRSRIVFLVNEVYPIKNRNESGSVASGELSEHKSLYEDDVPF